MPNQYKVLTFDCYGTLIDWESGILSALRPVLLTYNKKLSDGQILDLFAELEQSVQKEGEYIKYRGVLRKVMQRFGNRLGFTPSASELNCLVDSLKDWLPFPDTIQALKTIREEWQEAANGRSLFEISGNVGMILDDVVRGLSLDEEEVEIVLGHRLNN